MPGVLALKVRGAVCMPALVRWGRNHSAEPGTAGRPVIIGIQVDAAPRAGDNEPAAPVALETAVYFICAEALANVAKHARVAHVDVRIRSQSDLVIVLIADDGVGGADPRAGSGLKGVADWVGAFGGRLVLDSPAGSGTRLVAEIPAGSTLGDGRGPGK